MLSQVIAKFQRSEWKWPSGHDHCDNRDVVYVWYVASLVWYSLYGVKVLQNPEKCWDCGLGYGDSRSIYLNLFHLRWFFSCYEHFFLLIYVFIFFLQRSGVLLLYFLYEAGYNWCAALRDAIAWMTLYNMKLLLNHFKLFISILCTLMINKSIIFSQFVNGNRHDRQFVLRTRYLGRQPCWLIKWSQIFIVFSM